MTERPTGEPQLEKGRTAPSKAAAADLAAVATELEKVKAGTLTLPEKTVFRQTEIAAAALAVAASSAAKAIGDTVGWKGTVLVTDRTDQIDAVLLGRAFREGMSALTGEAERFLRKRRGIGAKELVESTTDGEGGEAGVTGVPGTALGAVAALAIAGVNLLGVDTSVEGAQGEADALETHTAVMQGLLPKVAVRHGSIGIPSDENAVLQEFSELLPLATRLDARATEAADAIAALGDEPDPDDVAPLRAVQARAGALGEAVRTFVTTATTAGADGGTPLLTAARAHELCTSEEHVPIAVVRPARLDAHQISLRRRILASKLVVTASATIDVLVLDPDDGRIVAAGSHSASRSFQVRFPMWWWPFGRTARERPDLLGLPVYTPLPAWPLTQPGS